MKPTTHQTDKATARPWKVIKSPSGCFLIATADGGDQIAALSNMPVDEADANLIVSAVNEHYESPNTHGSHPIKPPCSIVEYGKNGSMRADYIRDQSGFVLSVMTGPVRSKFEQIVTAVNEHAALLALEKAASALLASLTASGHFGSDQARVESSLVNLAAIRKAGGQ